MSTFFVPGVPLPKGSGSNVGIGHACGKCGERKRKVYIEMADRKTKTRAAGGLKRWSDRVQRFAEKSWGGEPLDTPIELHLHFRLPPPKKSRFDVPATKPDLSKLIRAVEDALTGVTYTDDSRIVCLYVTERWARDDLPPGVEIEVMTWTD